MLHLTLLHFNDLHGRLEALPRLFTLIQRERTAALAEGRAVLILDGGDSSDRARWESDITKGRANFAVLEAMGVQATVIGNGDALHWGSAALAKLAASVHFPVLAANLVDCADPSQLAAPMLKASTIVEAAGVNIGIVGVTAVYNGGYDRFGYTSADPLPALRREVERLNAQGIHIILLLSHLGSDFGFPEKDPRFYHDEDAARDAPELTAIVGAHTHTRLETPVVVNDIPIVQAGEYGQYLGRLDVEVDPATGRAVQYAYQLFPTEGAPPDPTISATLELVREEANRLLDARIGEASQDLPHYFDQPSPFANRIADGLREMRNAELCIFFNGYIHKGLAAGPITRRNLYEAIPGSGHVTAANVTGAQIRRMVERMLASPYRTQSFNPKRNEPPMGLPAHSSNVQLNYQLPTYQLQDIIVNGLPLDPQRRCRLVSTYFTLNDLTDDPEYDFIGLEPGQAIEHVRVEEVLWEIVEDWVKARGVIE
jgi:2',3'-cyclic-nucleotide 2'-phosphodiesterase (5'-nucleotidase family)